MPDFQEPSGEELRRQSELIHDYESMILNRIQPRMGADFDRTQPSIQSRSIPAPRFLHLQHWELCLGDPGLCQVRLGPHWLAFPLLDFTLNNDAIIIRFTVLAAEFRAPIRTFLRLQEGDIFGDILEWRYHRDAGDLALNVILRLRPESFEMSAQRGEAVRYRCTVSTAQYLRNATREELLIEGGQSLSTFRYNHEAPDSYYRRLDRAGLLPDRAEALEEFSQGRAVLNAFNQAQSHSLIKQPALCNGCQYLHGHTYRGTKLVCGMHPYGNGENCSDFKAKT